MLGAIVFYTTFNNFSVKNVAIYLTIKGTRGRYQ